MVGLRACVGPGCPLMEEQTLITPTPLPKPTLGVSGTDAAGGERPDPVLLHACVAGAITDTELNPLLSSQDANEPPE